MRCMKKSCTHQAQWAPKICVPAQGWPIDCHQPLAMIVGLRLCREHVDALKAEEFFNDVVTDIRGALEALARTHIRPDFARAFITAVRINSDEFRKFEQLAASREQRVRRS
jgi:hypothetical protein